MCPINNLLLSAFHLNLLVVSLWESTDTFQVMFSLIFHIQIM